MAEIAVYSCYLRQLNKKLRLCNKGYTPVLCRGGRRGRLKLAQKSSRIAYGEEPREREATSEICLRRFSSIPYFRGEHSYLN
jgi:hypothetical protein